MYKSDLRHSFKLRLSEELGSSYFDAFRNYVELVDLQNKKH